ncbi:glycosyltransferase family 4 protein [Fictibacillus enclensis]|uniref:glycosyltransferase family 4 protein n=1 Tax=Fictibacillus enclensis TaxID=1017270 RepID=UPI0024BF8053|nr:glycosyltransferase [Fictibacillus enclensis]WHY71994.1 glycosyltransferase [Fictibacillus enclensis]
MKVGILVTSIGNFGKKGYYNSQEIGLAKELDKLFEKVIVYKCISETESLSIEKIQGCKHTYIHLLPTKNFGINGFIDLQRIDNSIDALIYFSDTQIIVPKVYKWCKKNNVKLIPYIGVLQSHSENFIKKNIINILFKRNISVYRKCDCLVKNPQVQNKLQFQGIKECTISPVGLDLSILKSDFQLTDSSLLKTKWGYSINDKVLLFIGRLVQEKRPLKLISIFKNIHVANPEYKLLIVGRGVLYEEMRNFISVNNLEDSIRIIEQVPNTKIWELYKISEAFINLNEQEIFGMAILEAMYFGCKVVASRAPGPNYIIEHGVSGYLVSNDKEIVDAIHSQNSSLQFASRDRVVRYFTWKNTAEIILNLLKKDKRNESYGGSNGS